MGFFFFNLPESGCNQGAVLLSLRQYPGQPCLLVVPTQGVTPHAMLCSPAGHAVCSSPGVGGGDRRGLPAPGVGSECLLLFSINSQKRIFHLFLSRFQQSHSAAWIPNVQNNLIVKSNFFISFADKTRAVLALILCTDLCLLGQRGWALLLAVPRSCSSAPKLLRTRNPLSIFQWEGEGGLPGLVGA